MTDTAPTWNRLVGDSSERKIESMPLSRCMRTSSCGKSRRIRSPATIVRACMPRTDGSGNEECLALVLQAAKAADDFLHTEAIAPTQARGEGIAACAAGRCRDRGCGRCKEVSTLVTERQGPLVTVHVSNQCPHHQEGQAGQAAAEPG